MACESHPAVGPRGQVTARRLVLVPDPRRDSLLHLHHPLPTSLHICITHLPQGPSTTSTKYQAASTKLWFELRISTALSLCWGSPLELPARPISVPNLRRAVLLVPLTVTIAVVNLCFFVGVLGQCLSP